MGKLINAYRILASKPEGKLPLREASRWEDNIKMYLREVNCEDVDIHLARERVQWRALVNTVINLRVPLKIFFTR
jgi:hypothetical protein